MKFQVIALLSALGGTFGIKQVIYPFQDSTIFAEDDKIAKGVGANIAGLTEDSIRRDLLAEKPKLVIDYFNPEEMVVKPTRRSLRKRRLQNGGDGEGGDGDGGDGNGGDGTGGDSSGGCSGDGNGGDGDGGDGVGGDGEGGDGYGGDGEGGDGNGGDGEGGDGEGGDGDGGDGNGGDGEGGDDDGGDDDGGCNDGNDGEVDPDLCFSAQNTIEIMGQGLIDMSFLEIGDYVRVQGGKFARVYSFGHYEKSRSSNYLQIQAAGIKTPLEITKDHMVFILDGTTTKSVPASSIKIGDSLATENGSSKVSKIDTVKRNGAYAPFTTSGDIIVSGIVASNYISMIPQEEFGLPVTMQWIAHTFKAPHRLVCAISFNICKNETYTKGLSNWIYVPYHIGKWLAHQNVVVKVVGSALLVAIMYLSPVLISVLALGFFLVKLEKTKAKAL
eukprot:CAMPEP_0194130816 /NCGR_PEP_ID=MMETSP0152-20130528/1757_1 /TAXON_ID=1049557 /ORGANISM="Thalassiothrix antarctica, Strain L6-D1" /LENGTH=442 /DNA_ID=CAMNT_0038825433 /DNA_START=33 /DNA_END=1361 /DNA_ORIENTATION=-